MSKIIGNAWFLPGFSVISAAVFVTVHLTSGQWKETPNIAIDSPDSVFETGREETGGGLFTDEGLRPFTYVPTSSPNENNDDLMVPVPTSIVIIHIVPQNEEEWEDDDLKWNIPFGQPTPDPALLYDPATPPAWISTGDLEDPSAIPKWNYPPGSPTPDPARLVEGQFDPPIDLSWNIPKVCES